MFRKNLFLLFYCITKALTGAYIKYEGGGAGGFYKIFKKNFLA